MIFRGSDRPRDKHRFQRAFRPYEGQTLEVFRFVEPSCVEAQTKPAAASWDAAAGHKSFQLFEQLTQPIFAIHGDLRLDRQCTPLGKQSQAQQASAEHRQ